MTDVAYTTAEAKKRMGVGNTKFYEEINAGRLKAKKSGKKTLIPAESLSAWLANLPDYPAKNAEG